LEAAIHHGARIKGHSRLVFGTTKEMNAYSILIPFIVTFVLLLVFLKTPLSSFALDKPNARSLHVNHVPRTGGLALVVGVIATWLAGQHNHGWILLVLALMFVSLVDDLRGLSVRWRLLVQLLVSASFIWLFLPNPAWWLIPFALLGLVWMTNLYNFMDGSDGLAGGMAMSGFGAFAIAAYSAQNLQLAQMCGAIVASSFAYLMFNFYPAKIFMGDSGSIPLGFLVGAIGLHGWQQGIWPYWFPLLAFSPFVVDATVTLLKRTINGEKMSEAHKTHYYQRLVQMGWGHKKTALVEYALMLLTCGSAILMLKLPDIWIYGLLFLWVLIYAVLMLQIDKHWQQHQPKP
jgi:UDP-GlcNAc:undecaprenyl-phosphate/decaprenyl-phosphate GlcNAc-1-phosphate transferase